MGRIPVPDELRLIPETSGMDKTDWGRGRATWRAAAIYLALCVLSIACAELCAEHLEDYHAVTRLPPANKEISKVVEMGQSQDSIPV